MEPGEGPRGGAGPSDAPDDDDWCVYTYRGGAPAEAEARPPGRRPRRPRAPPDPGGPPGPSTPDEDYLEMDFDPPCDAETDAEAEAGDDSAAADADAESSRSESESAKDEPGPRPPTPTPKPVPPPSPSAASKPASGVETKPRNGGPPSSLAAHTSVRGDAIYVRRTVATWPAREGEGHRGGGGDLVSPGNAYEDDRPGRGGAAPEDSRMNLSSALFHSTMAKRLVVDNHEAKFLQERDDSNADGDDRRGSGERPAPFEPVPKCMVWTETEACARQITQIGTSACGATSAINALAALGLTPDVDRVKSAVGTRQRANDAPLCRYVISRAIAGCGVRALAAGLSIGSNGAVSSRHFALWPERKMSLSHWLAYWIASGGVPIATLNLQAGLTDSARTPDSWHHQMIFGVGPRGIYMANPLECIEEGLLWHQLCSDPVLLVKRKDILSRWTRDTDLRPLLNVPGDERWTTMNVLGQVVNMIRESQQCTNDLTRTAHIKIPACYSAGITIAVLTGSDAHKQLILAPELPLLYADEE